MDIAKVAQLSREDIAAHLPGGALATHKIIQLGLVSGPLIFAGVIVLLQHSGGAPAERIPGDSQTGMLLSAIGALCLAIYLLLLILPGRWFKPTALAQRLRRRSGEDAAAMVSALANDRLTYGVLRTSLFEAAAMAGLMIPMLATVSGTLADEPQAYLGALPTAIHLLAAVIGFPSRQGLIDFIHDRLVQPLRRSVDAS